MKIYTKTGDNGTTSLDDGKRVSKSSIRVNAYGDIDELSSSLGLAASFSRNKKLKNILQDIQHDLFVLGSLTTTSTEFNEDKILKLESLIDEITASLNPLKNFILPGGIKMASSLHMARATCRRAERTCIALAEEEELPKHTVPYLNRLSDLLFTLARKANKGKDIAA